MKCHVILGVYTHDLVPIVTNISQVAAPETKAIFIASGTDASEVAKIRRWTTKASRGSTSPKRPLNSKG